MRICIEKSTGRIIEMQSDATAGTLLANAIAYGLSAQDIEEREVTPSEYVALMLTTTPQPDWAGFQSFCFTDIFAGDSALVSQLIDRYPSFLFGIQTRNLGIVQAAVDRALADHTLNPTTGIPQQTHAAILDAMTTYHLEGA